MKTCATCRFFVAAEGFYSHCRRYPPRPTGPKDSSYPVVLAAASCGEWRWNWRRWLGNFRIVIGRRSSDEIAMRKQK